MEQENVISCRGLEKDYPLYGGNRERLKALMLPGYRPKTFRALSGVDFVMRRGEIVGMIGLNGSGKSTLASIIAGIVHPSRGEVQVRGKVDMLAASAGMDTYLTGQENISYKCLLMGMTPRQTEGIREEVVRFADIGVYIDQPVRTYSSGMRSRLGFAISVHMNPDILLIDEALAVGDNSFTDKCLAKMMEFKEQGKTILFVSHAVTQMKGFCDRVFWLNRGHVVGEDVPDRVIMPYCGFAREVGVMSSAHELLKVPRLRDYQEKYL